MFDAIEEGGPRLFRGQYHVVSALDHQKLSFRNSGRKPIGLLEWLHAVVTGMDHQRRHIDLFQQLAHIEAIDCGACGDSVLWRRGLLSQCDEQIDLPAIAVGSGQGGEGIDERVARLPPKQRYQPTLLTDKPVGVHEVV